MPRWLITGGCGFIGSNLVRMALQHESEPEICNLDLLTYSGRRENLAGLESCARYRFVQADIADPAAVAHAFAAFAPEIVIHLAAETHVDRSIESAHAFVRANVLGTQVLLDAARHHNLRRFLQVSSDEVYGALGPEGRFTESSPLAPNSPYAASKAASDLLVRAAFHTHRLPAIIVRASNNYGPRQFPEKLIPLAITNAEIARPIPLYGDGNQVRHWLHVDDHCRGLLAALARGEPGQIYNLAGAEEVDNRSLLEQLLAVMGRPVSLLRTVADRPGHDFRYALDTSRARRELDWTPQISLTHGLRQTVAWYRANPAWVATVRDSNFESYYRNQYGVGPPASTTDG